MKVFPCVLHKLVVLNASQDLYNQIKKSISTLPKQTWEKITLDNATYVLENNIPKNQREKRYFGT